MRVRLHSVRARALLACVPATAMVFMATAGTASAAHTPANTRAELRTALEHLLSVHPSRGTHFATLRGVGLRHSTNSHWSGYADTGKGFSSVAGKWKEPKISGCSASSPLEAVVFWVGIDGFNNQTVEQDGTAAVCGGGNPVTYFTWWEMFPTNTIQFVGATVKAGSHSGTIKSFPDNAITMELGSPDNDVKPGPLNTAGNSFKDTQLAT